jgi:gas vesicle protein
MSEQGNGSQVGTVFLAFVAGAAVGAGLTLLVTPRSGEQMRESIKDLSSDAVDKIKEYAVEAQDKIMDTFEQGKEMILDRKNILASALEAGKEAMAAERERLKKA